jgi:predicted lactoylglutathione lyase
MATDIFVNLPVRDLNKSVEFFTKLGYQFNAQFTDETATCMIVGEHIFVMLLTHDKFKTFTPKAICDATKSTEVLVCLSVGSRAKVNEMVGKAVSTVTSGNLSTWSRAQSSKRSVPMTLALTSTARLASDGRSDPTRGSFCILPKTSSPTGVRHEVPMPCVS